jgi:glycosyltransferase involved in cell wall biosynthesis
MKLSIIIPVFNEKDTLPEILKKVAGVNLGTIGKEVIIVDDCSTDGTAEILKNLESDGHRIFFQEKNQGKGAALRRGFKEATGDIIIIQDADLEYDPTDYPVILKPILDGQADVVYGSRFLEPEGAPRQNRIVYKRGYLFSRMLNWMSNILSGAYLSDIYTCYKVFSRNAIDRISPRLRSNRFGIDPELTAWTAKFNFKTIEVPISYQGRTYKEGKKINWKDGIAAIFHIIRYNLFARK